MARYASPVRYSQAILQIALERDEVEVWSEDLRALVLALQEADLSGILDAPQVPLTTKTDVVRDVFPNSISPLAINLISLLAAKGLTNLLPGILEEYERLVDDHMGVETAEVVSAVPLDSGPQSEIVSILEGLVNRRIKLSVIVDRSILGGFVAKVGDRVIDGSLKSKLREMRRRVVGKYV